MDRRRTIFWSLLPFLLLLSCDEQTPVLPPELPVYEGLEFLDLAASASLQQLGQGDVVDVVLTVDNPTDGIVRARFSSGCILGLWAYDAMGNEVAPCNQCPAHVCTLAPTTVEYAPGSFTETFRWTACPVPAGEYTLVAGFYDAVQKAAPITVEVLTAAQFVDGDWIGRCTDIDVVPGWRNFEFDLNLELSGDQVSGRILAGGPPFMIKSGTYALSQLQFEVDFPSDDLVVEFEAEVCGPYLDGTRALRKRSTGELIHQQRWYAFRIPAETDNTERQ